MGQACASAHSNHGFRISATVPEELLDNKDHTVKVYSFGPGAHAELLRSSVKTTLSFKGKLKSPRNRADIVARDLSIWGLEFAGHLGIWDGIRVIEVLNESDGDPNNTVKFNSWENFIGRSTPWDTLYLNIPWYTVTTCFEKELCNGDGVSFGGSRSFPSTEDTLDARNAMIERAYQIQAIGANYTATPSVTFALPKIRTPSGRIIKEIKGEYRCDTFIMDLFSWINSPNTSFGPKFSLSNRVTLPYRRIVSNEPEYWRNQVSTLLDRGVYTPVSLYNTIKTFK